MTDLLEKPVGEFDWGPAKPPLRMPPWYLVLIGVGSALLTLGLVWLWG